VNAYALGRLHELLASTDEAGRSIRSDAQQAPIGNYNRRFGVASIRITAMQTFGQYGRCSRELRGLLHAATATDNRALSLLLTRSQTIAEQVEGKALQARKRLDAQRALLPANRFGLLHVLHLAAVISTACWTKDYAWADEYLASMWPEFLRSPLRRSGYLGVMAHSEHARLLLNQQLEGVRASMLPVAPIEDLRALSRSRLPAAGAFVERFRARIAILEARPDEAIARLRASRAAFEALDMLHEAARDQFALGVVIGGEQGALLQSAADQRMRELGVVVPRADVRAHFPELTGAG
jgi:hypothetical protein